MSLLATKEYVANRRSGQCSPSCPASGHEVRPAVGFTQIANLTALECQALLIGLSDARHRRPMAKIAGRSSLNTLLRLIFGREVAPPLANPSLEALRNLAMRSAARGVLQPGEELLEPELILAAGRMLTECGALQIIPTDN